MLLVLKDRLGKGVVTIEAVLFAIVVGGFFIGRLVQGEHSPTLTFAPLGGRR